MLAIPEAGERSTSGNEALTVRERIGGCSLMSIYFFGLMVVALGLEGFSRRGLPFSSTKRITGRSARAVGVLCIAFGMGLIAAFYLNSPSIERTQMNYFSWGVLFGCGWTWQATRRQWP